MNRSSKPSSAKSSHGSVPLITTVCHGQTYFHMNQCITLSESMCILQEWTDHKFVWEPEEYGGVRELYVPSEHIWLPDIVLYNK